MKKLCILLLIVSVQLLAQTDKTTKMVTQQLTASDFFSDTDIVLIDSLLLHTKYQSPLYDTVQYVLKEIPKESITLQKLTTEQLQERLAMLDAKTPFNIAFNPALEKVIHSYLKYRKRAYPNVMAKAAYYFPMFEKHLDQFNIPLEMKYLAIVESTLNPTAKSRVGATGLWQFMYATGKEYKLEVSSYVDERQDPVRATIAACKYLSRLYKIFGDWDLVLAAYNSGPGNVSKAIKRSGGYRNYWNIRPFLPKETAGYVPAFYATMYLFEYADAHGLVANAPVLHQFETDTIQVKKTISFDQISEKTGISTDLLRFLNPAYKLEIIPFIKGKNYVLTLPRKNTLDFLNKEQEIYDQAAVDNAKRETPLPKYFTMDSGIRYRVKNGDYLGKIAEKFGVRVRDIKRWNNLRTHRLKIGQRLRIYPKKFTRSVT